MTKRISTGYGLSTLAELLKKKDFSYMTLAELSQFTEDLESLRGKLTETIKPLAKLGLSVALPPSLYAGPTLPIPADNKGYSDPSHFGGNDLSSPQLYQAKKPVDIKAGSIASDDTFIGMDFDPSAGASVPLLDAVLANMEVPSLEDIRGKQQLDIDEKEIREALDNTIKDLPDDYFSL